MAVFKYLKLHKCDLESILPPLLFIAKGTFHTSGHKCDISSLPLPPGMASAARGKRNISPYSGVFTQPLYSWLVRSLLLLCENESCFRGCLYNNFYIRIGARALIHTIHVKICRTNSQFVYLDLHFAAFFDIFVYFLSNPSK